MKCATNKLDFDFDLNKTKSAAKTKVMKSKRVILQEDNQERTVMIDNRETGGTGDNYR